VKVKLMRRHKLFRFWCFLLSIYVAVAAALIINAYRARGLWDLDLLHFAIKDLILVLWLGVIAAFVDEISRLKKLLADALAENGRLRAQAG
jgi:hypothetical protein